MNQAKSVTNRVRVLCSTLTLLAACNAQAQIPTTDVAAISQSIAAQAETIVKWVAQYKQLEAQITEAKNLVSEAQKAYQSVTGARGMGDLLNNPTLSSMIPEDLTEALNAAKSTAAYTRERAKYPRLSAYPITNDMFDVIAKQNATNSEFFAKTQARVQQVKALMQKIDSADDPAAKQDLMNRLLNEQNSLQANQQVLSSLAANQKIELEAAGRAAAREFRCKEFKTC